MKNSSDLTPLVSICCTTYNHEAFIRQALDNFLTQQTSFAFEIVIHDDASTDKTASIIKEYTEKHPSLFKPLYQTENQKSIYKSGMNPRFNYPRAKGKYIAICEGDDYWTDPHKLQKQVDFLEENPDYVLCFTNTQIKTEDSLTDNDLTVPANYQEIETLASVGNYIHTPTVVFKNIIKEFPSQLYKSPIGDYFTYMLLGEHGKFYFLNETTTVYRKNVGTFSSLPHNIQYQKMTTCRAMLYDYFNENNNTTIAEILKPKVIQYFRDTEKTFTLQEINTITKNDKLTLAIYEFFYFYTKQKKYINSIASIDLLKLFFKRLFKNN